jgi:hypothetical protein
MNSPFLFPGICLKSMIFFILLIAVCACTKEGYSPSLPIHQPQVNDFNKGFTFQEDFDHVVTDWVYYNTDTVSATMVKFIALDSSATSWQWTIGAATYTSREISLIFPAEYLVSNKQLPVI